MQRIHLFESKSIPPLGGNVQLSMRDLPVGYRIRTIILRLELVFTTGAAATLIPGSDLFRIFQNIEINKYVKTTGQALHFLGWLMRGAEEYLPASIPATNSTTFRRWVEVAVPYRDNAAWSPADTQPQTDFYRDTVISIDIANVIGFGAPWSSLNTTTPIQGTVRALAMLDESNGQVGSEVKFGYVDWSGQTAVLEPGLYSHLYLFKETGTITTTEVSNVALNVDGRKAIDNIYPYEIAGFRDWDSARGGAFRADSATAPVAGEQVTQEPGTGAAAAATVTQEFMPIFAASPNYKITQLLLAESGLSVQFTGSLTTFRIGYRRLQARSADAAVNAFAKLGQRVTAGMLRAKTESKAPLAGDKRGFTRYMPLRAGK